jgi:hypothetical protein
MLMHPVHRALLSPPDALLPARPFVVRNTHVLNRGPGARGVPADRMFAP